MKKLWKYIKNFFLCKRYPWLRMRNVFTGKFCGYKCTWYDVIPEGWKNAFGKQLINDINQAAGKHKHDLWITDIKEKWGRLNIYTNGTTDKVLEVIHFYEDLSICYCIECGKPARWITPYGYISYLCNDCSKGKFVERLTKDDIPHHYDKDSNEIDIGIDYYEMWGIDEK